MAGWQHAVAVAAVIAAAVAVGVFAVATSGGPPTWADSARQVSDACHVIEQRPDLITVELTADGEAPGTGTEDCAAATGRMAGALGFTGDQVRTVITEGDVATGPDGHMMISGGTGAVTFTRP